MTELKFEKRGIGYLKPLLLEVQAQEQTQELRLTDGMPDIGRILGTWGQVILRGKEWRGDSVACNGGVMANVLYATEDGGGLKTMQTWIPFQMKWNLDDGHRDGELRVQCMLRFLDARSVSPRKMMLRCGISAGMEAYRRETAMVSEPGQIPEDIQLLKNRYPIRFTKAAGEKTFPLEENLSLPDGVQLVSCCLTPRLSEVRLLSGKLVLRGSGMLHCVYLSGNGKLESRDLEIPISQLGEPEGEFSQDAQGSAVMAVTNLETELGEGGQLKVKAGLLVQYVMDDREILELVEDVYSPRRQVEPEMEELELPRILEQKQAVIPVRQNLRQNASQIADVTYLPDFPTLRRAEGLQVELPGTFQVMFYDESGNLNGMTARTEENWDMPLGDNVRVEAAVLPGSPATAAGGSGIELKGESVLSLQTTARHGLDMVTGLKLGEEQDTTPNRPSLILRRAGDQGLWNIAKSTGSTVEAIRQANSLEGEPEETRILLIPVS
jgi:hypothetical protein